MAFWVLASQDHEVITWPEAVRVVLEQFAEQSLRSSLQNRNKQLSESGNFIDLRSYSQAGILLPSFWSFFLQNDFAEIPYLMQRIGPGKDSAEVISAANTMTFCRQWNFDHVAYRHTSIFLGALVFASRGATVEAFKADLAKRPDKQFVDLVIEHGWYFNVFAVVANGHRLSLCNTKTHWRQSSKWSWTGKKAAKGEVNCQAPRYPFQKRIFRFMPSVFLSADRKFLFSFLTHGNWLIFLWIFESFFNLR